MTISQRLFKIMDEQRVSIPELSYRTGISKQTIYDWKKKGTNPGADKIMIICEALRITPEDLLVGKPEEDETEIAKISVDEIIPEFDDFSYKMAKMSTGMTESQRKRLLAYMSMLQNMKE